jgi:hypothetical protein
MKCIIFAETVVDHIVVEVAVEEHVADHEQAVMHMVEHVPSKNIHMVEHVLNNLHLLKNVNIVEKLHTIELVAQREIPNAGNVVDEDTGIEYAVQLTKLFMPTKILTMIHTS